MHFILQLYQIIVLFLQLDGLILFDPDLLLAVDFINHAKHVFALVSVDQAEFLEINLAFLVVVDDVEDQTVVFNRKLDA